MGQDVWVFFLFLSCDVVAGSAVCLFRCVDAHCYNVNKRLDATSGDPFSGQTAARAEVRRSDVNRFCVALCLSRKPSVYASHWACLRNCQTRVHCSTLRVYRPHSRIMANQQDDFDDLAVDAHTQRERDIEKCAAHRCAASIFSLMTGC